MAAPQDKTVGAHTGSASTARMGSAPSARTGSASTARTESAPTARTDRARTEIIGLVGVYEGDGHPHVHGYTARVMWVVKPGGVICNTNDELAAAGGLDPEHDILEVVVWLPKYRCWGCVPSDVRLADLRVEDRR